MSPEDSTPADGETGARSVDGTDHPSPPYIECGRCGSEHHYDHALPDEGMPGICPDCSAFLRQPTEEEHQQFTEFLKWNTERIERRDAELDGMADAIHDRLVAEGRR